MVTPFDAEGALDLDGAVALARWLQDHGNDGLVIAGTTGEAPTLSDDEQLSLIAAVAEAVTIPVVAGTTTNDTAHSVELTRRASALPIAGILTQTPYYNRPSQDGIEAHFRAVAAATDKPVMLYDIPVRSGRKIASARIVKLAHEVSNIVSLKDAAGNPSATAEVIAQAPSLEVYSGDSGMTLPLLAVGAVGVVGVASHWTGPEHQELFSMWGKGDVAGARAVNARMLESFAFETGDEAPNPLPAKAMMRTLGHAVGQCRLPMGDAPPWLEARAREVWANLRSHSA